MTDKEIKKEFDKKFGDVYRNELNWEEREDMCDEEVYGAQIRCNTSIKNFILKVLHSQRQELLNEARI